MTRTLSYSTGRFYDFPQVLEITISDDNTHAQIDDPSRHMTGMRVDFSEFRQKLLNRGYDDNRVGEWCLEYYDKGTYSWMETSA